MKFDQYRIVLVNLDPTVGSEIRKTRPCVILSPDEMNNNVRTLTIAPMTTKERPIPTRVKIFHNSQEGWVILDQIRTIDRKRVIRSFERLSSQESKAVKAVIRQTFVD